MSKLIGIDTNVLARYILQDDEQQSEISNAFFDSLSQQKQGFVSHVVLVELIWLLKRGYKQPKHIIADVVEQITDIRYLQVQNPEQVKYALQKYKTTSADFSDVLISQTNISFQCEKTITFDKKASKHADMTLLN